MSRTLLVELGQQAQGFLREACRNQLPTLRAVGARVRRHPIEARLDSALLYTGLLLPFLVYINRHPETRMKVGLPEAFPTYPPSPAGGHLMAPFDHVCFSTAVLTAPLLAFGAFVTVFHDFQYHAIIRFHHRNRYHRPEVDQKQFGWASKVSRNLFVYTTSEINLFGAFNTDALLASFVVGFPLHHYFVD